MIVSTGGGKYNFYFSYNYNSDGAPIASHCTISRFIEGELVEVSIGTAYCHPDDTFSKERARKMTMTRALESLFPYDSDITENWNNMQHRKAFWDAYLNRKNLHPLVNGNR